MRQREIIFTSNKSETAADSQLSSHFKPNEKMLVKLANESEIQRLTTGGPRFRRN